MSNPAKFQMGVGQVAVVRELIAGYLNFETKAELIASGAPLDNQIIARVTADTAIGDRGNYQWNGSEWVKSPYDPLNQANEYTDLQVTDVLDILRDERIAADLVLSAGLTLEQTLRSQADQALANDLVQETLARQEDVADLSQSLAAETAARVAAISALSAGNTAAVTAEQTARMLADAELSDAIDAEELARQQADTTLTQNLAAEVQARQDADAALSQSFNTELNVLQQADNTLTQNLATEVQARQQADNTLTQNLATEVQARQTADNTLTQNLATEVQARQQADADLAQDLIAEAQARQQADTTLTQNLAAEVQARQQADTTLTQNLAAETAARTEAENKTEGTFTRIFGNLRLNSYHDDSGNRYLFAVVNPVTQKLLFGVSSKLKVRIGNVIAKPENSVFGVRDKAGQYAIAITKSGKVYIPKLALPASLMELVNQVVSGLAAEISARQAADSALTTQQNTTASLVSALNSQFVFSTKVHDDNGNRLVLALLHRASGKIAFGINRKGQLILGGSRLGSVDYPLHIQDRSGQTALLVRRNGKAVIPRLELTQYQLDQIPNKSALSVQMQPFLPQQINHHVGYGQSLSIGVATAVAISTSQPYSNIMLGGGPTKAIGDSGYNPAITAPLVESNSVESPTAGTLNGFVRRIVEVGGDSAAYSMLGTAAGVGGQRIATLTDEGLFVRLRQHIIDAKALADAQGKTYAVSSITWVQGEADITGGLWTRAIDYYQRYLGLMTKIRQLAVETSGQTYLPTIYSYQTAAHSYYNKRYLGIAIAQWRASVERPDVCLAVPAYRLPHAADNLHLTAEGSWLLGEYIGRAMFWTMVKGQKWRPLEPTSVAWNATHIDVKFHVPCKPIQLSTLICNQAVNQGFDIWNNGSVYDSGATSNDDQLIADAIQSVSVLDEETIRIHLNNSAVIPAGAVLSYGRGRAGDPQVAGPVAGARGNVMDSHGLFDTAVSPLGTTFALYNVSVYFEYSRENGFF